MNACYAAARVGAEAEQRLVSVCRHIVEHAAADAWATHTAASPQLSHAKSPASETDGSSWDAAIRAPLIVDILDSYKMISDDAWKQELRCCFRKTFAIITHNIYFLYSRLKLSAYCFVG